MENESKDSISGFEEGQFVVLPPEIVAEINETLPEVSDEVLKQGLVAPELTDEQVQVYKLGEPLLKAKYHLVMKFNDQIVDVETDNLAEAIQLHRPNNLKTRVLFTITDNETGKVCERMVFTFRARQIFRNKTSMLVFINTLIFK